MLDIPPEPVTFGHPSKFTLVPAEIENLQKYLHDVSELSGVLHVNKTLLTLSSSLRGSMSDLQQIL